MKTIITILLLFVAVQILPAQTQTVTADTTTNANRVIFIFTLAQQKVWNAVYGDIWKAVIIEQVNTLWRNAIVSADAQATLTKQMRDKIKAFQDSIAYYRSLVGQ